MPPNKNKWRNALEDEIESMKENQVWKLIELSKRHKAIGNKWVLTVKRKVDGTINRYKECLVAKGYTQKEGIDYDETFSLIIRFASIHLILAIVASLDLELHQMNVKKKAFLNRGLEEEFTCNNQRGLLKKAKSIKYASY